MAIQRTLTLKKKYYATAQSSKFITLDQLCEHIAQHDSLWTPDVVAIVAMLQQKQTKNEDEDENESSKF